MNTQALPCSAKKNPSLTGVTFLHLGYRITIAIGLRYALQALKHDDSDSEGKDRSMRLRQWGAGALLTVALLASAMTGILYHISMIGFTKAFGPLSGGATIALYGLFAIVALVNLLSIPVTFVLGIVLLATSARKNPSALFCALFTCLVSASNLLFWLFYCGGIPGTAQRPFP